MLSESGSGETESAKSTGRLEAFSDGVMAIAITLLILDVRVPDVPANAGPRALLTALWHRWPNYDAFLISFVTIGIIWANHHNIFRFIARTDQRLIIINTLLLLCVSVVPFTTALLGAYLGKESERAATMVYAGWFFLTGAAFGLLWWYPTHDARLVAAGTDPALLRRVTRRFQVGAPLYLLAFVVAWFSAAAGLAICFAVALYYVLPGSSGSR